MNERTQALLNRIPVDQPYTMAEIGVFGGTNSFALLQARPKLVCHMIDPWMAQGSQSRYERSGGALCGKPISQATWDEQFRRVVQRASFFPERAIILRAMSLDAAVQYDKHVFDMVFIDGDHTYEGVLEDLAAWEGTVKLGGWLCGHDYINPQEEEWGWGVTKAVNAFAGDYDLTVEPDIGFTWFIRKDR